MMPPRSRVPDRGGMGTPGSAPPRVGDVPPTGTTLDTLPWYSRDAAAVAGALGVDVARGLSAAEAAARLDRDGPNALPEEKARSSLRRFLDQYTSYMQLILVGAAVVSLVIKEW